MHKKNENDYFSHKNKQKVMKVIHNGQTMYIRWSYANPQLMKLVQEAGLSTEQVVKMTKPQLAIKLGLECLPKPTLTTCILSSSEGHVISAASVKFHSRDKWSRDVAREESLGKLVNGMYPGTKRGKKEENLKQKNARTKFWSAYFSRVMPKKGVKALMIENKELRMRIEQLENDKNNHVCCKEHSKPSNGVMTYVEPVVHH